MKMAGSLFLFSFNSVSQSLFLRFLFGQISKDLIWEARVATGARKFDYITPILKQLHRLPVVRQLEVGDAGMAFKCLHGLTPAYLRVIRRQVRTISSNFRRFNLRGRLTIITSSYMKEGRFHAQKTARRCKTTSARIFSLAELKVIRRKCAHCHD